jgi:multidrug resistance efflux pump
MNGLTRIPVPWKHRWRRFRYSSLPMFSFVAFVGAAAWLWTHATQMPHAIGEVEAKRVVAATGVSGVLKRVPREWRLFDKVAANQVVAQLDDGLLSSEMATLQTDLARLQKEVEAAKAKLPASEADRSQTYLAQSIQVRFELEQRRIAALTQQVQVEGDRLEAERTNTYFECIKPLYEKKMISEQEYANARLYRDEAAKRLAENLKVADEAKRQQRDAEERLTTLRDFLPLDVKTQLAPIAAAIDVQNTRIAGLEVRIKQLTIHAPNSGVIAAIHHWPGENVPAGEPILTIASDKGSYLVSFVRQEQHVEPEKGMAVDVRKRAAVSSASEMAVESVGPQIEPIPQHLCRDPKIPEWGLPVRIALPDSFPCRPGELFEVTFKKGSKDAG